MSPIPSAPWSVLLAAILLSAAPRAAAADVEVREFATRIDGKAAGQYRMTITRQDDGSVSMAGQADIKVTKLGVTFYHYSYRGTETWKAGRLVRFSSSADDDGTRYTVSAVADGDQLRVTVNGQERPARADVWLTTYWRLPEARQRAGAVPLLDGDCGKSIDATIEYLGTAALNVAGKVQTCSHYRVTGKLAVDLWFDPAERLVRQEWVEDGHRVQIELSGIR